MTDEPTIETASAIQNRTYAGYFSNGYRSALTRQTLRPTAKDPAAVGTGQPH
ncbi:hypothetical protein GCM10009789_23640 [Kribbella sancticallisti]|uniref:Uncharacterized protein n=1 Tax=Kribbella sancticallisti TaxID=460087 RepID=A0ABP4NZ89_9ACTN